MSQLHLATSSKWPWSTDLTRNEVKMKSNTYKFLGLLFIIIFSLCSTAQTETISKDTALKAIEIFENEPLSQDGEGAASIITTYASESEDINIVISDKIITWLGSNDKDPYYKYRGILLAAYLAGNVKSQIVQGVAQDDPYSGLDQVLKTYHQLQKQDMSFNIQEIEKIKKLKKNKHLKEHIKKVFSNTK